MSTLQNDEFFEAREEWLERRGRTSSDIMSNEIGEYVYVDIDNDKPMKVYLPDNLQTK